MPKRAGASLLCTFIACGLLALAALPVAAGYGGRGGGGRGGYYGGYRGAYYGGHGGFYGYYGGYRGGYYGYYRGYGWGYGGFGLYGYLPYPYWGVGVGGAVGYPPYVPYGVSVGVDSPPPSVITTPPAPSPDAPPADAPPQPKADGAARLMLLVPANAQVWFDGQLRSAGGTEREYVSPVLETGRVYAYSVRVRYVKDDGTVSDETRSIKVWTNDRWVVDFTRPAPRREERPADEPLPKPAPVSR
jgi:uncharacterized protein (TIGR03000 family)